MTTTKKVKVNIGALREKLNTQDEKAAKRDPKNSDILAPLAVGKINFRAFPYPHSADPSVEPFIERYYHWGIYGRTATYCPKRNENKECHICNFVWDQVKARKAAGDKAGTKEWAAFLPKLNVLIAGKIRGREDEGPKFFRISSDDKKKSDNHKAVYDWFRDEDEDVANWMDGDAGFDIVLDYVAPDAAQSAFLRNAKFMLNKMELARKQSAFGEDYDDFLSKVKNIDVDVFPKQSTEETLEILKEWRTKMAERKSKSGQGPDVSQLNSDETETVLGNDDSSDSSKSTEQDDVKSKLDAMDRS